jgi:hypothetical protein
VVKPASIELGPYQLMERIGEGGSGHVYRARGPAGTVAVKMLGPAAEMDEATRARFGREIAALRHISHPNLIGLLDHGLDPELGPYLVLPLLAGTDLRALCARAMCPEAALLVAQPIAHATAALHAAGFVHRDLKPENAIASPDGTITVIDLGLAWREGMTRHTDTGAAVGSVGYMSPEQIEGRRVDAKADVWAIGVMIYEWIAGKRPFARARPAEEAAAVLLGVRSLLTAADRRCSPELANLVDRCLAIDPAARPSAAEVAAELDAMIDWIDVEMIARERAAVVADPFAYQARVAPFRVRRLERLARDAIAANQPFAALAFCDRGLAYAPDNAELLAMVAAAEEATAQRSITTKLGPQSAPPKKSEAYAPTVEMLRGPRRRRRMAWIAIGFAGIAVGAIAMYMLVPDRHAGASAGDPWADPSPGGTRPPPPPPQSPLTDKDRALVGTFFDLWNRGMAQHAADQQAKTAAPAPAPPKQQQGVDAIPELKRALAKRPDWVEAQIALCVALVMSDDPEGEAVAACERAAKSKPDDETVKTALAAARLRAQTKAWNGPH